jgi:hypothetical protein
MELAVFSENKLCKTGREDERREGRSQVEVQTAGQ